LTVKFTDTSVGNPISLKWDFNNDGITDSEEQNPAWTYKQPGKYTVSLTVSNGKKQDTKTKADYIFISIHDNDLYLQDIIP